MHPVTAAAQVSIKPQPKPESKLKDKVAALVASAQSNAENRIKDIDRQRQEDMQIIANRFNKQKDLFATETAVATAPPAPAPPAAPTKAAAPAPPALPGKVVRPMPPPPPPPMASSSATSKRRSRKHDKGIQQEAISQLYPRFSLQLVMLSLMRNRNVHVMHRIPAVYTLHCRIWTPVATIAAPQRRQLQSMTIPNRMRRSLKGAQINATPVCYFCSALSSQ